MIVAYINNRFDSFKVFAMIALVGMLGFATASQAQLHEGDFVLTYDEIAGSLTITPPVLKGTFGDSGFSDFTSDPGIDTVIGELPANQPINFNILSPIQKWNGSDYESTTDTITISFGPLSVTTSTTGPTAGFSTNASSSGEFHRHYNFVFNDSSAAGIYLMEMELFFNNDPSIHSNPFYIVFNQNDTLANHEAAYLYVENNIIPEPASAVLLLSAGMWLMTRRMNRYSR